eukprot:scaffold1871_cov188-Prasinococcus_capsulatus_cf.AAC.1
MEAVARAGPGRLQELGRLLLLHGADRLRQLHSVLVAATTGVAAPLKAKGARSRPLLGGAAWAAMEPMSRRADIAVAGLNIDC